MQENSKDYFYCACNDDSHYWGRLINVFAEDVDTDIDKVEMLLLHYKENGYDFRKKEDRQIIDAKYLFFSRKTGKNVRKSCGTCTVQILGQTC